MFLPQIVPFSVSGKRGGILLPFPTQCAARCVESFFPADARDVVRAQFADVVRGIFAQRLLPRRGGGRIAVFETLVGTPAVRNVLRQGRYDQLETLMMSGAAQGMQTAEIAEDALRARGVLA